ncbi:hypothetical protein BGLT_02264 [Caballeronia glathei]|uniref:Uncharacterized protein n=1 Tax=Caballeronia glathei TaxID=60547 RepID=A0A069PLG5_9BURK|nr:hypothetical protein [Caballeronia glathei]KDR41538.1 hypothetical protein BG61_16710 [Caballeronia glathei]CDY79483.1 hypothetical protein BGLT_02264 [Caballeronia glathei]
MSRFYELSLTPQGTTTPTRVFTSHPKGVYDPAALEIEYDALVGPYGTPSGASTVTLRGISLKDLTQSQQFAGMTLELKAGMKAGLPLVNPAQAGTILKGQIFQSYGNWEGVEQTLDFVVIPATFTIDNPGNFVLNWTAGTQLSTALQQTFSVAYPNMPVDMHISSDFVQNFDEIHVCGTLDQLAQAVSEITEGVFDNPVTIGIQGGRVVVFDKTFLPTPIQLAFTDFVGQPTWIAVNTIQLKMVARADLVMGGMVRMPQGLQNLPGFVTTSSNSFPSTIKNQTTFQNNFIVSELRQIGSFRSADATQWVTIANCIMNPNG